MASRLPRLIALVTLVALAARSEAQGPDTLSGGQVVTGETLRRAGATRLSDVLLIAGRWDVASVDGFTWHASPLGGEPFHPARWTVLVDGRRMEADLFGTASLDRLGVALEQVSSVELIDLPRLVAGGLTTDGLIHIRTTEPAEGPSASGWFTTGSEIGDPGPFAYTPQGTPNVDRAGHGASAELGYGRDTWFASAALAWGETVPTDPAIVQRYVAALGRLPRLRSTAPAIRAGARIAGGRHEAVFRGSDLDGALELSPLGTEIATDERFTLVGIAGSMPVSGGRQVAYDVSHSLDRARSRPGPAGPGLDWEARTIEARAELTQRGSLLELAGLRLRRRSVHSPATLDDPTLALGSVYATLRLVPGSAGPTAGAAITVGEGDAGFAALLARGWSVTRRSTLEGALTYERRSRGEDNTIWAWTARGYGLLEEAGAEFAVAGSPRSPERLGADLRWTSHPAPGVAVSARALYRRSRRLSLERRNLHYVPAVGSFEGAATIVHGAGGEQGGGSAALRVRALGSLDLGLSYWVRDVLAGDRAYREAWAAVPRHGARATVEYAPARGLDLWMAAGYRSPSRWAEFAGVEAESGGRYRERLRGAFTLDLALQKLLWDGRLRAHFGIRNILAAELRYHPAGALFAPTATLQLEAALP